MAPMLKAIAKLTVLAVALVLLYHLEFIRVEDLAGLVAAPGIIALVVALCVAQIGLAGVRFWLLLRAQGVVLPLGRISRITMIATFGNAVLPGTWGGDAVKAAFLLRDAPGDRPAAMVALLVDRLVGLVAMLAVFGGAALLLADRLPGSLLALGNMVLVGLGLGLAATVVLRPWCRALADRTAALADRTRYRGVAVLLRFVWAGFRALSRLLPLAGSLVLGVGLHGMGILAVWLVGRAMGAPGLDGLETAFLSTLAFLASLLPVTPGGIGIGEAAFAQAALSMDGMDAAFAYGSVFLAFRVLFIVASLPGLALVLASRRPMRDILRPQPASAPAPLSGDQP